MAPLRTTPTDQEAERVYRSVILSLASTCVGASPDDSQAADRALAFAMTLLAIAAEAAKRQDIAILAHNLDRGHRLSERGFNYRDSDFEALELHAEDLRAAAFDVASKFEDVADMRGAA